MRWNRSDCTQRSEHHVPHHCRKEASRRRNDERNKPRAELERRKLNHKPRRARPLRRNHPDNSNRTQPSLTGLARLNPGIVYKEIDGEKLMMDVLQPQVPNSEHPHFPTVLFIQGSAFQTPDRNYEIPQLAELARRGFVIATVNHRNCTQGHPFPAFMEDVKAALRFLRAHSDDMFIDPERIGVWGTSSGGTTSLLMGLTSGLNMYNDGSHAEMSDKVAFAVDCFGISEPRDMIPHPEDLSADLNGIWVKLLGVSDLSESSLPPAASTN